MMHETIATDEPFRLETYFDGKTKAWGVFQDMFGRPQRQFVVDIDGRWDGETLTLVEDFLFSDGETEQRTWHIRPTGDGGYEGRADDVIGVAKGQVKATSLNWSYLFGLRLGSFVLRVRFSDWFFLMGDGVLINRADITKFGIRLGQATIVFRPVA